jgi:hypothetical protein
MKFFIMICMVLFVLVLPFAPIWALNTLFGLTIAYTFKTWMAMTILVSILNADIGVK